MAGSYLNSSETFSPGSLLSLPRLISLSSYLGTVCLMACHHLLPPLFFPSIRDLEEKSGF